jgi:hypothetical protein
MISTKIKTIAKKCREICEQFAHSQESVDYHYHKNDDLYCMCAVASFFFKRVLSDHGILVNCRKSQENYTGHVFNEIGGVVIDLTATQFNSDKKVHVDRLDEYEQWLGLGKSKICLSISLNFRISKLSTSQESSV